MTPEEAEREYAATVVAAALTFAAVVWWLARRGRQTDVAESPV